MRCQNAELVYKHCDPIRLILSWYGVHHKRIRLGTTESAGEAYACSEADGVPVHGR
jgi:hypothetical protein